jgi:hypothetical protein
MQEVWGSGSIGIMNLKNTALDGGKPKDKKKPLTLPENVPDRQIPVLLLFQCDIIGLRI